MNIKKWLEKNTTSLKNKKVVVTGATGGLGKNLCFYLASLDAHLILACRNQKLANELKDSILAKYPNVNIDLIALDLSDISSVVCFVEKIKEYRGIDVLIHNAGVYNIPIKRMNTGYNNIFQINFVSPYYLTKKLMPELKKKPNSKCLIVGSIAHNYSKINMSDVDFSSAKKPSKIYGNSKRFLMFSLYELFKGENDVSLSVVHPGITLTNMTNHYPKAINWLVKIGIKLVFPSPEKATLNLIYGIFENTEYHEWIGPKLFNIWGKPQKKVLKTCSVEESKLIFELSEDIYNKIVSDI